MTVNVVRMESGGHPWFAVVVGDEPHPVKAVWLDGGVRIIQTKDGPVSTDGSVRFFPRKRDLLAAVDRTGFQVLGPTKGVV